MTKAGTGTLVLSGVNTYTGATTVSAGTLSVAADSGLGTGTATLTLAASTTLQVTGATTIDNAVALSGAATIQTDAAVTLSGAFSGGAQALTKTGTGTLTLSGSSNKTGLTGGVTVSAGTLAVATDAALVGGTVTLAGGTLGLTGTDTFTNAIAIGTGGGTIEVAATKTGTLTGSVSGSTLLTKTGAGTLCAVGDSTNNTHTGATTISAGGLIDQGRQLPGQRGCRDGRCGRHADPGAGDRDHRLAGGCRQRRPFGQSDGGRRRHQHHLLRRDLLHQHQRPDQAGRRRPDPVGHQHLYRLHQHLRRHPVGRRVQHRRHQRHDGQATARCC